MEEQQLLLALRLLHRLQEYWVNYKMVKNSKERLEQDRAAVRKFQAETERRANEVRRKIAAEEAQVKKFFKEGR